LVRANYNGIGSSFDENCINILIQETIDYKIQNVRTTVQILEEMVTIYVDESVTVEDILDTLTIDTMNLDTTDLSIQNKSGEIFDSTNEIGGILIKMTHNDSLEVRPLPHAISFICNLYKGDHFNILLNPLKTMEYYIPLISRKLGIEISSIKEILSLDGKGN
jgi:hypothetical protein